MNPFDFTSKLPQILVPNILNSRAAALSGFANNKTANGPLIGAAGELIADAYFTELKSLGLISGFKYTGNTPGHDYEVQAGGIMRTFDVKTKRRTFAPQLYFEMSVPDYLYQNPTYVDPDYFLCVQVNTTTAVSTVFTNAWVIGAISKANYILHRKFVQQGSAVGGAGGITGAMPTSVQNVEFRHFKNPTFPY